MGQIDWTTPIEDRTKQSKIWKIRGNEKANGGCYICGSQEDVNEYAFGRLHVNTLEQHITTDSHLAATKRYSYAPPVYRKLCKECISWEYSHVISKQSFGVFLLFGLISLVFGMILAFNGGFSKDTGWMIFNCVLFLVSIAFLAAAVHALRPRKQFSDENGDIALAVIFTNVSSNDIHNLGYYIRSESGKTPIDPLRK